MATLVHNITVRCEVSVPDEATAVSYFGADFANLAEKRKADIKDAMDSGDSEWVDEMIFDFTEVVNVDVELVQ